MAKKKLNRVEQVKQREDQKKKIYETIAGTKSYISPVKHNKSVDLSLLAEAGYKFAEEDKDFLNKTKEELAEGNKEVQKLNEMFLGIGNHAVLGSPFGSKTKPILKEGNKKLEKIIVKNRYYKQLVDLAQKCADDLQLNYDEFEDEDWNEIHEMVRELLLSGAGM